MLRLSAFEHSALERHELSDLLGDVLLVLIQDSVLSGLSPNERHHQVADGFCIG